MTTKGRAVPALPSITLKNSGIDVKIRSLGPWTLDTISTAAAKEHPRPTPQLNTVIGLDGKEQQEPNEADPAYQAALAAWGDEVQADTMRRLFRILQAGGVVYEPDLDAVADFRAMMAVGGVTLPDDDREVFFYHLMLGNKEDSEQLINAVMHRSQPTEEAVEDRTASFSSPV
jgi:hypothetical protein